MQTLHREKIYHRCFAGIHLDAIEHNFDVLSTPLPEKVKKMAIVKADAYGHGALPVAKALEEKADYFGVACVEEAIALRQGGITKPILILSYTAPFFYERLVKEEITATVYCLEEARELSRVALSFGKRAKVHVALDTGMGRIGFLPTEESADQVKEISLLEGINLEGIFSHYACADSEDKSDADEQTRLFDRFLKYLEARGVKIPLRHICNSAGAMTLPGKYDMCRLGIAMYGLFPSEETVSPAFDLRPAMEVVSRVIHVKTVPKGTKIGYGHIYTAPSEKRIATVSIGYADGYNRCLAEKGYVLIRGKRASIVGKVCMDQIMVDVTEIPETAVGDDAVILGKSEGEEISAETLGEWAYSFNYEVVCTFLPRVVRIYYRNSERIG